MSNKTVVIDLPDALTSAMNIPQQDIPDFVKKTLAVELYREGKLSLGKAAELAGAANKWEMLAILNERKVPLQYTAEDAEMDIKSLSEVVR